MKRIEIDADDLIGKYQSGQSAKKLGEAFGISRKTVRRILVENGVHIRGLDESQSTWWRSIDPSTKSKIIDTLNKGRELNAGSPRSEEWHRLAALGREASPNNWITKEEIIFRDCIAATAQKAIGKYSVDLAWEPIAVEIHRADCIAGPRERGRFFQRMEHILDGGWSLAIVVWTPEIPLSVVAAENVISWSEPIRSNPPDRGQYRVIWGDGKLLSAGDHDTDELARIWPNRATLRMRTA